MREILPDVARGGVAVLLRGRLPAAAGRVVRRVRVVKEAAVHVPAERAEVELVQLPALRSVHDEIMTNPAGRERVFRRGGQAADDAAVRAEVPRRDVHLGLNPNIVEIDVRERRARADRVRRTHRRRRRFGRAHVVEHRVCVTMIFERRGGGVRARAAGTVGDHRERWCYRRERRDRGERERSRCDARSHVGSPTRRTTVPRRSYCTHVSSFRRFIHPLPAKNCGSEAFLMRFRELYGQTVWPLFSHNLFYTPVFLPRGIFRRACRTE